MVSLDTRGRRLGRHTCRGCGEVPRAVSRCGGIDQVVTVCLVNTCRLPRYLRTDHRHARVEPRAHTPQTCEGTQGCSPTLQPPVH